MAGNSTTSRIVRAAGEQHHQPVDADADAAGRRHAVLERADEVLVVRLRLLVAGGRVRARCSSKRARWSSGSLSSVNALANSMPPANASKRSTRPVARERWRLANGDSSTG